MYVMAGVPIHSLRQNRGIRVLWTDFNVSIIPQNSGPGRQMFGVRRKDQSLTGGSCLQVPWTDLFYVDDESPRVNRKTVTVLQSFLSWTQIQMGSSLVLT